MKSRIKILPLMLALCLLCACGTSTQGSPQVEGLSLIHI